ncbi:MAG: T9SS type A sorting domain-containing protein [Bacteroidia bacterium]|nr:T9SS type A sorting domain-containing protein [Bacteroidota bacterium]MBP9081865.1 T9SS type A sorting domain-containing protein [Bacteroidia bacterium]
MKKLFALFFVLISTVSFAQEIEWQNTIGGSGNDWLNSIAKTADGGYILGGTSRSNISGDKTENSNGIEDYWIVKTDSIGNIKWQNTIGGVGVDAFRSVIQTADMGYLLGGWSDSNISGDKSEDSLGGVDFWIVKTDSIGAILWQNTIGGSSNDYLQTVIQTTDGGYLIGGWSYSNISIDKTENSLGSCDFWVIKIDSFGNVVWENTIGGMSEDKMMSLIQTTDGGYLLGGWSFSNISGDKSENSNGGFDYWIVKVTSIGTIQWQNSIGGSGADLLFSVIQTYDGGYLLGGFSTSNISGDKTEISFGGKDYWVVKTDSLGIIQWDKTIGGLNEDELSFVIQNNDNEYLVGGFSSSGISYNKTESSQGIIDYWIVNLDSNGKILWQNTIGGIGWDSLYSAVIAHEGGYVLGGYSNSNISGDKIENCNFTDDYWIVKIADEYNLIQGKTFADLNSNHHQEPGDPAIPYLKITQSNTNRFAFSQPTGFYSIAILDTGNFEVAPDYVNLFNPVPLTHTGNFSAIQQVDSLNDFALQPTGTFNDLCISISPLGNFRSGFNANYALNYSNLGTTTLIPTIVFYPDNNVTFVSASITPTTITPDSIVFVLGTMNPFQSGQITITVNVNTGLPIGTLINSGAMILPILNDANPGCNSSFWEVFTTGSYDPNDILVNRNFIYDYEMPAPPDLEYIIRYQNTGNDTAFTVKILNPLDTNRLDLSTLEMVATSHPADIRFVYHERNLEFVMNNILLPDSNINEPRSHGFVRYRIKPKSTVAVGDSIQNFAAIYFDFNYPVITNIAVTKIIQPTGVQEVLQGNISIFPNPTNNKVTIRLTETAEKVSSLNIFNIYGQEVKSIRIAPAHTAEIDISDLSQGVYFIRINNKLTSTRKVIKL